MKRKLTTGFIVSLMAACLGACGGEQPGAPQSTAAPPAAAASRSAGLTIAMIAKSTTNPVFLSARKGAENAAKELAFFFAEAERIAAR